MTHTHTHAHKAGKGQTMTLTRIFNAPRDRVWHAWTDERTVQKWWGPKWFTNPVCMWDAVPHGTIDVLMQADDRKELGQFRNMRSPMGGRFREVVKPEKLVFTTTALGERGEVMMENLNTVAFKEKDGKTEAALSVIVLEVAPEMMGALAGMEQGWSESFDKLEQLLAS